MRAFAVRPEVPSEAAHAAAARFRAPVVHRRSAGWTAQIGLTAGPACSRSHTVHTPRVNTSPRRCVPVLTPRSEGVHTVLTTPLRRCSYTRVNTQFGRFYTHFGILAVLLWSMLPPGPGRHFGPRTRLRSSSIENRPFISAPQKLPARYFFSNSTRLVHQVSMLLRFQDLNPTSDP